MPKPTLHLLGLPHTIVTQDYSHCAFTQQIFNFGKMMQMQGYTVIEYSNDGSESKCANKISILNETTRKELYKEHYKKYPNDVLNIDSELVKVFNDSAVEKLYPQVQNNDIILHPYGPTHKPIVDAFPEAYHIEPFIGYNNPYLPFRVYVSESHRHYVMGLQGATAGSDYNWVIPHFFDENAWQAWVGEEYILYMGRIQTDKGIEVIKEIAKAMPKQKFIVCGSTDLIGHMQNVGTKKKKSLHRMYWDIPNIFYKAPVTGIARLRLLNSAKVVLVPTRYVEPGSCIHIEAMMCGVPVITSDFGVFTETIEDGGIMGARCKTLGDWVGNIEKMGRSDFTTRSLISSRAKSDYGLKTAGEKFDKVFKQISDLKEKGWYTL